jgi:Uma2 family endonuclease
MDAIVTPANFRIPRWVTDLASFRRWAATDEFPEQGRLSHLKGDLWVDLSMETLLHNKAKVRMTSGLDTLVEAQRSGHVIGDRMRLTHPEAELSTEPDGLFISNQALQRQRVQLTKGAQSIEVIGSPDMVLEVVSASSVEKDTVVLPRLYWKAGIEEYWLVDPRGKELRFDIFRSGAHGFTATRKRDGWLKSLVFDRSFRLTKRAGLMDLPEFTFEVR